MDFVFVHRVTSQKIQNHLRPDPKPPNSEDVLHPCTYLWVGRTKMTKEKAAQLTWSQAIVPRPIWHATGVRRRSVGVRLQFNFNPRREGLFNFPNIESISNAYKERLYRKI